VLSPAHRLEQQSRDGATFLIPQHFRLAAAAPSGTLTKLATAPIALYIGVICA
jgi:hypothetical protein